MEETIKYAYVHFASGNQSLKVFFDDQVNEALIEMGWYELVHELESGKNKHYLFCPCESPVSYIEWDE